MGSWRLFVGDFFELNPKKANTKLRVKMIVCKGICFLSFQKEMAGYRKNASLSYRSSISSICVERRNRRQMVICPIPKNIFQENYMLEEHCEQGWKRFWESFLISDVGGHTQGQLVLNLTPVRVWSSSNVNKRSCAWEQMEETNMLIPFLLTWKPCTRAVENGSQPCTRAVENGSVINILRRLNSLK